jgi:homoserine O-succinyltransferase
VAVFNLMPLKEDTEIQLGRMLSCSDHKVEVTFVVPDGTKNKNAPPGHIASFYKRFSELKHERFDGVLVTGAPVEHLPFTAVAYWDELKEIFEWIRATKASMFSICWGAMASIYHFHGVPKHVTAAKQFGVVPHKVEQSACPFSFAQGLPDGVGIPKSTHASWQMEDMRALPTGVEVLAHSADCGPCVVWDGNLGHLHMLGHFEYAVNTLDGEYRRDLKKGTPTGDPIAPPMHYYPEDDPDQTPIHSWSEHGKTFYGGWLDHVAANRQ